MCHYQAINVNRLPFPASLASASVISGIRVPEIVPSFAVDFEAGHATLARRKHFNRSFVGVGFDGDDVPDVVGDDVTDDEIDVAAGVALTMDVAAGVESVSVDGAGVRGFNLDAAAAARGPRQ
jgi:hypothetical protein